MPLLGLFPFANTIELCLTCQLARLFVWDEVKQIEGGGGGGGIY